MSYPRVTRRRALAAGAVVGTGLLVGAGARARSVEVIAHRGFAAERPENTLEAVRYAVERADAIEVDVRRCGSGELVCIHDATLDRVTDATGRVSATDWDRLRTLSVGSSAARVPLLADVLAAVPDDVRLNVELKVRGLAPDLLALLEDRDGPVRISSFDAAALARVRSLAGDASLAYICDDSPGRALEMAATLDCTAVHPSTGLCAETTIVDRARDHGFEVNAWTIDSSVEAAALALEGVDGVFADAPIRGL